MYKRGIIMRIRDVTIVIPSYKPSHNIVDLVAELGEYFERILIVDDGGGTAYEEIFSACKEKGAIVVTHSVNQGKGRALKTAFNYCLVNNYVNKGIVTVDGDGQHKVCDVVRVAEELLKHEKSVVLGCREFDVKGIPFRSKFGNGISRVIYRWACGLNISDTQTGLRGIPSYLVPICCRISGEKYDYETNMLLTIKDSGADFREIKIQTVYEGKNEQSHFNPLRDSILIYAVIIKYSISSLVTALVDYISFSILIHYLNILPSTYASRFIASLLNFYLNKNVVFGNRGNASTQFVKYILLVVLSGTLSGVMITLVATIFPVLPILLIKIPVEIVLYVFNYLVQRKFIFKEKAISE